MAYPAKDAISTLDFAQNGLPFVVIAASVDAATLDYAQHGLPFYAAGSGAATLDVVGSINASESPDSMTVLGTTYPKVVSPWVVSTQFGQAEVLPQAAGFCSTAFGNHTGWPAFRVMASAPSTVVSMAYYPFVQDCVATGSQFSRVGTPFAFIYEAAPIGTTGQAFGFNGTAFGAPSASWVQTGQAAGSLSGAVGSPAATLAHNASGFQATNFGPHQSNTTCRANGFKSTAFGAPALHAVRQASSTHRATRFGVPVATQGNTYTVYGFTRAGRVGHPRGWTRIVQPAQGFTSTMTGSPTSSETHRARHLSPVARIGTPSVWFAGGGQHGHATCFTSTTFGAPTA